MSKELTMTPGQEEFQVYQVMAKKAAESKFFYGIGGEAGILSIMLMARELGLPPMQSIMGGMNIIQGKVEISPRMMNTMIRKAGHKLEILESTEQLCKIKGTRNDTKEEYMASFSIDDAKRAGLVRGGGGWEKYASDMLFARCISRLARRLFADVISTAYVEGEIDRDDDKPEPVKVQEVQKAEEAVVIQQEEFVSPEQVQEIENNIAPDDKEYRANLLEYYGKIPDFSMLPKKNFAACMKSIMKRAAKFKVKVVEAAPAVTEEEW
jgi:hypothetical protein